MTGWHLGRLGPYDLETTAPDPEQARIVTATVGMVGGGEKTSIRNWIVDPGVEIPAEAAEIHGVTTERARAEGMKAADGVEEIVSALAYVVDLGVPVVAYNAPYDFTVIDRECRRLGLKPLEDRISEPLRVIDPLCIDKALDRYRKGKRTLTAACEFYKVALDGAHDSEFDAVAAARVAYRMGQRGQLDKAALGALYADRRYPDNLVRVWQQFGRMDLDELHAAQVVWYREQSENFAQYLRQCHNEALSKADSARDDEQRTIAEQEAAELAKRIDGMSYDWPLRPYAGGES